MEVSPCATVRLILGNYKYQQNGDLESFFVQTVLLLAVGMGQFAAIISRHWGVG